jgi:glycerophosphoryl diester phosphodiesterase
MICFIELKGPYTAEQVKGVFDLAASVYDLKKCILQSFSFENLLEARSLFPELPLMWTYGRSESHYERCFEHGFSIDVDQYVVTQQMLEDFHARGLEVGVWTVNEEERVAFFKAMGVDYIESDFYC